MRADKNVYLLDTLLRKTFNTRESFFTVGADGEFVFLYLYNFEFGHTGLPADT